MSLRLETVLVLLQEKLAQLNLDKSAGDDPLPEEEQIAEDLFCALRELDEVDSDESEESSSSTDDSDEYDESEESSSSTDDSDEYDKTESDSESGSSDSDGQDDDLESTDPKLSKKPGDSTIRLIGSFRNNFTMKPNVDLEHELVRLDEDEKTLLAWRKELESEARVLDERVNELNKDEEELVRTLTAIRAARISMQDRLERERKLKQGRRDEQRPSTLDGLVQDEPVTHLAASTGAPGSSSMVYPKETFRACHACGHCEPIVESSTDAGSQTGPRGAQQTIQGLELPAHIPEQVGRCRGNVEWFVYSPDFGIKFPLWKCKLCGAWRLADFVPEAEEDESEKET